MSKLITSNIQSSSTVMQMSVPADLVDIVSRIEGGGEAVMSFSEFIHFGKWRLPKDLFGFMKMQMMMHVMADDEVISPLQQPP